MESKERKMIIRKILVALDASPTSLAAMETAADLATSLDAELLGLFVEDINLIRPADLPFTYEIGHYSATPRRMDYVQLEQLLRAQASWARRALANRAKYSKLRWSFEVARGAISQELLSAALDADLIILGKSGWSRRRRMGSTALAVASEAPPLTIILTREIRPGFTAVVVYDGSESAKTALATAVELALDKGGSLDVLVWEVNQQNMERMETEIVSWAQEKGLPTRIQWLPGVSASDICTIMEVTENGVLVLPRESPLLTHEILMNILEDAQCPVMLVR